MKVAMAWVRSEELLAIGELEVRQGSRGAEFPSGGQCSPELTPSGATKHKVEGESIQPV